MQQLWVLYRATEDTVPAMRCVVNTRPPIQPHTQCPFNQRRHTRQKAYEDVSIHTLYVSLPVNFTTHTAALYWNKISYFITKSFYEISRKNHLYQTILKMVYFCIFAVFYNDQY
jgi:hypothetical protein